MDRDGFLRRTYWTKSSSRGFMGIGVPESLGGVAIETLNEGRIGIAAQMAGIAQGAFDLARGYALEPAVPSRYSTTQ